jgi:hypothetical protein
MRNAEKRKADGSRLTAQGARLAADGAGHRVQVTFWRVDSFQNSEVGMRKVEGWRRRVQNTMNILGVRRAMVKVLSNSKKKEKS